MNWSISFNFVFDYYIASSKEIDVGDFPVGLDTNFFPNFMYGPYLPLFASNVSLEIHPMFLVIQTRIRLDQVSQIRSENPEEGW